MRGGIFVAAALALLAQAVLAQETMAQQTFIVAPKMVADEKAVFATVESANIVPARARIGGTVAELAVKIGDAVKQGAGRRHDRRRKAFAADKIAGRADRRPAGPVCPGADRPHTR